MIERHDYDDLSLENVATDRREAETDAKRDAAEFYRFIYGDNRTDDQLRYAYILGERTPEAIAGYKRFYENEAKNWVSVREYPKEED